MDIKDTIVILGNSPFIKEVENKINYVLDRYYSIGINNVIDKLSVCTHAFLDYNQVARTNRFPNVKTITLKHYDNIIKKDDKEMYHTFTFDPDKGDIVKDSDLAYTGFTHDFAISYCILKKVNNIILIGAADFIDGNHYSGEYPFKCSKNLESQSVDFISNFCTKYASILTCNPNSPLSIPYLPIDELLK